MGQDICKSDVWSSSLQERLLEVSARQRYRGVRAIAACPLPGGLHPGRRFKSYLQQNHSNQAVYSIISGVCLPDTLPKVETQA